ncbi:MAG: UDP-3-O-[3-hydroxymyristoyl] N-acetylglucosamine deacetylase [Planctomycetota bacterium]|nr:MAG: UDP-3-O-[3-hydroxymyristoyl] N-acetylglucosamine deacetylase [Planctomycetota bacterium]
MTVSVKQKTLATEVKLKGIGLHSGEMCEVVLKPAPVNSGIILKRVDLSDSPEIILADGRFVNKGRRTAMQNDSMASIFEVETTEHLCAAFKAMEVDNVIVEIDSPELPGLDGSSKEQANAIKESGLVEQMGEKKIYNLVKEVSYSNENASIIAIPYDKGLKISYTLDYPEMDCSPQYYSVDVTPETFLTEIAPARTFCLKVEAEKLQLAGFGKGANTTNTLVIDGDSPIENKFRFENELARHKILDLIGDLSLLGFDVNMHIIANKSGHFENNQLINKIKKSLKDQMEVFDTLSYEQIKKLIPHRYPFLLVDKIIEMSDDKIIGIKSVTGNEPFFQGHFPESAVMPGVLQIEAMAQTAGLLFRVKNQDESLIPFLLTVDGVKLRKQVIPGDQLRIVGDVISMKPKDKPTKGKVHARCYVGDKLVSEAVIKFILVKRK